MRFLWNFRRKPSDLAGLCFFAGIFTGTIWGIRLGPELVGGKEFRELAALSIPGGAEDFLSLLFSRVGEAAFLWTAGMSLVAVPGSLLAAASGGFLASFRLSLLTGGAGPAGLGLFCAGVLPCALFYMPSFTMLLYWGLQGKKRIRGAGFLLVLLLTAAGAAAEVKISPLLLKILFDNI